MGVSLSVDNAFSIRAVLLRSTSNHLCCKIELALHFNYHETLKSFFQSARYILIMSSYLKCLFYCIVYILRKQQSPAPTRNLTLSVQPKDAHRNTTVLFATAVQRRTQRLTAAAVMGHFSRRRLSKLQNCSYWGA